MCLRSKLSAIVIIFVILVFSNCLIDSASSTNETSTNSDEPKEETPLSFEDEWDYEEVDTVANSLIDDVLENFKSKQVGPYNLHEDYEMDMIETFLLPFDPCWKRCKIKLINGSIYGMENMTRYDNVIMTNDGDDIIVQVRLQAHNLMIEGVLSVSLIGIHIPAAPFRNYIDYQVQYLDIAVGPHNLVRLRDLRVEQVKGVRMELTRFQDSKMLKKFSDMITRKILNVMDDQLKEVATKMFFPILANEFKYMNQRNSTTRKQN